MYAYCGEEFGTPLASNLALFKTTTPCTDRYTIDVGARSDIAIKQDQAAYTLSVSIR